VSAVLADAKKDVQVIHAGALSEVQRLRGEGTSQMRRAYLVGIEECMNEFSEVHATASQTNLFVFLDDAANSGI
jgi:hypothetical protein